MVMNKSFGDFKMARFLNKHFLIAMIILCPLSVCYSGTDVEKVIKNVQNKYKKSKLILIEFNEISRFSLTGTTSEVYGTLIIDEEQHFRLESEDQVMVNDGTTFWRYNKIENQVLIDHAKKGEQELLPNHFLQDISENYFSQLLEEKKTDGKKVYLIKLTPKPNNESFFTSIKIWIKDKSWEVDKVIYMDYNENETEFNIEKIEFDPQLTDAIFSFTAPDGSEIVDVRF
jgi:outer membrane lipoprotein-sorting protein